MSSRLLPLSPRKRNEYQVNFYDFFSGARNPTLSQGQGVHSVPGRGLGDRRTMAEFERDRQQIVSTTLSPYTTGDPPGRSRGLLPWLREALGGWTGAKAKNERPGYYVTTEKAAGGPRGVKLPAFLPFIDEITGETDNMRLWYRRMLRDPIVKAALLGKVLDVGSLDLHVNPPDNAKSKDRLCANFCNWNINSRVTGRVAKMAVDVCLPGLVDGYSLSEKVWQYHEHGQYEGYVILDKLKSKDTGNDVVLVLDEFRNVVGVLGLRYNAGLVFSPSDFALFRYLSIFDYPGGMSDLRAAYSAYWMLDTCRKLRSICLEKRAMPVMIGTYKDLSQRPALENVLSNIRWNNWIAAPEWAKVQALEWAGQAVDLYNKTIEDLKQDIFIGIQGAFLQALEGSNPGARGNAQVQRSTSDLFKWYLMSLFLSVINEQVLTDLTDLNFAGLVGYPEAVMGGIDEGTLKAALDIDTGLQTLGLSLSKKALYKKYGREEPIDQGDELKPPGGGQDGGPTAERGTPGPGGGAGNSPPAGGSGGSGSPPGLDGDPANTPPGEMGSQTTETPTLPNQESVQSPTEGIAAAEGIRTTEGATGDLSPIPKTRSNPFPMSAGGGESTASAGRDEGSYGGVDPKASAIHDRYATLTQEMGKDAADKVFAAAQSLLSKAGV